jgi:ABC-2 type transport system permease protein
VSHAREVASAAHGVLQRDWRIFFSYRARFVTQLLSMFFTLTLFYYISRVLTVSAVGSPDDYFAFVVVGLIILQVLTSTMYNPPVTLQGELIAGTFERLLVSPFGPMAGICSMLVFPFLYSLASGAAMLIFAYLVFGLPVEWSSAPLALPVAVLGTFAFSCFGVVLVGAMLVFKQAIAGTSWILALISLVAGLYFPVTLLPDWIEWASEVQPFTPTVDLLRNVLVGTPLEDPAWQSVLTVIGFVAVLMPLGLWLLKKTVAISRRRGTVLEY